MRLHFLSLVTACKIYVRTRFSCKKPIIFVDVANFDSVSFLLWFQNYLKYPGILGRVANQLRFVQKLVGNQKCTMLEVTSESDYLAAFMIRELCPNVVAATTGFQGALNRITEICAVALYLLTTMINNGHVVIDKSPCSSACGGVDQVTNLLLSACAAMLRLNTLVVELEDAKGRLAHMDSYRTYTNTHTHTRTCAHTQCQVEPCSNECGNRYSYCMCVFSFCCSLAH